MVVYGDLLPDGRVKVSSISYVAEQDPNGWTAQAEPEWPVLEPGKAAVMYFHPDAGEFSFEIVDRPLTQDEEISRLSSRLDLIYQELLAIKSVINV